MIYLNNDKAINNLFIAYPNGEFGIDLGVIKDHYLDNGEQLIINVEFNDSYYCEDILKLMMILDRITSIRYYGFKKFGILEDNILISFNYLPFSREDREENNRLCTFDFLVNYLGLSKIKWVVDDLHSKKVIDSPINIHLFPLKEYDIIIFPDKGSFEKYGKDLKNTTFKYYMVYNKERDKQTGKLLSSTLVDNNVFSHEVLPEEITNAPKKCLIIDDICSYGNTFKIIPKEPKWSYDLFTIYNEGLVDSIDGINNIKYLHKINFRRN